MEGYELAVVLLAPATGATPRDRLASAIYMADLDHVRRLMDQWHEGIEMIAQSPIDIGRRDELGRISLMMCGTDPQEDHVATDKACGEIGRLLIKAGADVDAIDEKEWSVVAYAASLGWSTLVQRLVKAGANISRPDNTGVTPLIKATIQGRDAVVKVLLDAGASSSQSGPHRTREAGAFDAFTLLAITRTVRPSESRPLTSQPWSSSALAVRSHAASTLTCAL